MLHHPTGVARGQASDVHNEGRELLRTRDYMDATLSVACGRSFDAIKQVPPPPPRPCSCCPGNPSHATPTHGLPPACTCVCMACMCCGHLPRFQTVMYRE